jgi:hypothetical protein
MSPPDLRIRILYMSLKKRPFQDHTGMTHRQLPKGVREVLRWTRLAREETSLSLPCPLQALLTQQAQIFLTTSMTLGSSFSFFLFESFHNYTLNIEYLFS